MVIGTQICQIVIICRIGIILDLAIEVWEILVTVGVHLHQRVFISPLELIKADLTTISGIAFFDIDPRIRIRSGIADGSPIEANRNVVHGETQAAMEPLPTVKLILDSRNLNACRVVNLKGIAFQILAVVGIARWLDLKLEDLTIRNLIIFRCQSTGLTTRPGRRRSFNHFVV